MHSSPPGQYRISPAAPPTRARCNLSATDNEEVGLPCAADRAQRSTTSCSTGFRASPCRAACARSSRHCSPSCAPSMGSSRTPTPRSNTSPSRIRASRACAPSPACPVTAAAFLAAIDDAQRFHHAHQLEAYLGLVAGERSSGETQRRGAITKAGHSRARWLLIQAAVSILRRRPPQAEALRTWALRIAARRGKQVSVVALARRLAGILYALLLCAAARWQCVRAPARSVSAPSRGWSRRPHEHVTHSRRGRASATKSASVNSNGPRDSMNTY